MQELLESPREVHEDRRCRVDEANGQGEVVEDDAGVSMQPAWREADGDDAGVSM